MSSLTLNPVNRTEPLKDSKGPNKSLEGAQHPHHENQSFAPGPSMPVFHYLNTQNGHQVTSPLPPDHPEMICLQAGGHITHTKFGILGKSAKWTLVNSHY